MKVYVGIDQSLTGTGVVLLKEDGEIELVTTISSGKLRDTERLVFIADKIAALISAYDVQDIAMEDYGYSSMKVAVLGELGGVIKYMLLTKFKLKPIILHNTKIKKWATGKGNADKNLVMMKTYQKYGLELKNDNEYDAMNIAKIIYSLNNPGKYNKIEEEVLKSIKDK